MNAQKLGPPDAAIKVWDAPLRICHWGIVIGFVIAYLSEDEALGIHVWAGYAIGSLLLLRGAWGFIGNRYARFRSFTLSPTKAIQDLREISEFRPHRHVGHGPAGSLMAIALLVSLSGSVLSGWWVYSITPQSVQNTDSANNAQRDEDGASGEEWSVSAETSIPWDEVHEAFVNLTALLAILHVLAVLLISWQLRENLTKSMITGLRRAD